MKRFLLSLVAIVSLSTSAQASDPAAAKSFVDGLAQQVLAIAKNDSLDKKTQVANIEALFTDKVDMDFVARFVLGKHWRTATPQQQSAYIAAYKPFILKNYANRLTKYSGQTYTLKNARVDGDSSIVTMDINDTNGQSFTVEYRLRAQGGSYKILDLIVEGVSLLATQRSEFGAIVDQKGIDGLTEALKRQVAAKQAN